LLSDRRETTLRALSVGLKPWIALTAALVAMLVAADASAAVAPYKTDAQADRYLKRELKSWARIDLTRARFKSAFCVNGY
jgi:hypothetical protein